jgi:hypothetical protein
MPEDYTASDPFVFHPNWKYLLIGWKSTYTGRSKYQFENIHIALYKEFHGNWATMKSESIEIIQPRHELGRFSVLKFEQSCKNNSIVLLTIEEVYRDS